MRRAVIRRPVHLRRYATMARTVLAKQLQRAIVGEHLHVVRRAIEQEPRQRRAVGGVDADACRRLAAARSERANEGDQLAKFGVGELKPRHAFRGEARANERGQLLVGPQRYPRRDAGSHLAALAIRAMTARARALECGATRVGPRRLRRRSRS